MSNFQRHFLGPLIIFLSLAFGEIGVRHFSFPITLAIPYAALSLTVFYWSGLRSALVSALLIALYPPLFRYEWYGLFGSIVVAAGAFMIAGPSGILKRSLKEQVLETETNRRKAELVDNLNGNIKKVLESLAVLDSLRVSAKGSAYTQAKLVEEIDKARDPLITLVSLVESWQEINRSRDAAFKYLDEIKSYPYRADALVREIKSLQVELIGRVDYLGKLIEGQKESKND